MSICREARPGTFTTAIPQACGGFSQYISKIVVHRDKDTFLGHSSGQNCWIIGASQSLVMD